MQVTKIIFFIFRGGLLNRLGEINKNKYGNEIIITKYNSSSDIEVTFSENGYIKKTRYNKFKEGNVKSPY